MMSDKPDWPVVVVTGMGVVTSLGVGKADNWAALMAGRSGIRHITRFPTENLRTTIAGTVDFLHQGYVTAAQRTEDLARHAAAEAVAEAGLDAADFPGPLFIAVPPVELDWETRLKLTRETADPASGDIGALIATAWNRPEAYDPFLFGTVAQNLAEQFGTRGSPISLSTACASGATAITLAVEAIQRGEAEAALAIGSDGSVTPESLIRFSLLSALTARNDPPEAAARPFAKGRDGFVMAEGAGALVLERLDHARARGARILGVLAGCGEQADVFHRTRSSPDGHAIIGAMHKALDASGLSPADIGYINAHGTGTPENDKMEALGVTAVFGQRAREVPISSNKSMIGHTLSAAGAVEAVFTLQTLQHQRLPATINCAEPDPTIDLDVVPNVARDAVVRHALSNSFGFGGQNACLVFSREPG
jgi:3-oxoacyl-[acyl-carrier-protein] synthase II